RDAQDLLGRSTGALFRTRFARLSRAAHHRRIVTIQNTDAKQVAAQEIQIARELVILELERVCPDDVCASTHPTFAAPELLVSHTEKASAGSAPWARGSVSVPIMSMNSTIDPGQPCTSNKGRAFSCEDRTCRKMHLCAVDLGSELGEL